MKHTTKIIRKLNDKFRTTGLGGRIMITAGVHELTAPDYLAVLSLVQNFTAFDPGNDPWEEHDFGAVEHKSTKYFWKIDYYERSLQGGSPDPADPKLTVRVLTIMRADEY